MAYSVVASASVRSSARSGSGVPPVPVIPVLSGRLLEATALSGNYYCADKYGDKLVLSCKMYEVPGHSKKCT